MPNQRGLVPPAILTTSTTVLILCFVGWGAFGVLSFALPEALSTAGHRYLSMMLATVTICSSMVYWTARAVRDLLTAAPGAAASGADDRYAIGYADGLDARPGAPVSPSVARLVQPRR